MDSMNLDSYGFNESDFYGFNESWFRMDSINMDSINLDSCLLSNWYLLLEDQNLFLSVLDSILKLSLSLNL